jgi:hypothetical protein
MQTPRQLAIGGINTESGRDGEVETVTEAGIHHLESFEKN